MGDARATILLAEDSDDDALILSHGFRRLGFTSQIVRVEDGEQAVAYLANKPRPDLLVLDLKMPRMDGFDVLAFIRKNPELNDLPVFVLTGSELPRDRETAQEIGVQGFFIKCVDSMDSAAALMEKFQELRGT
jgi:CheY-like chemotaxis protein